MANLVLRPAIWNTSRRMSHQRGRPGGRRGSPSLESSDMNFLLEDQNQRRNPKNRPEGLDTEKPDRLSVKRNRTETSLRFLVTAMAALVSSSSVAAIISTHKPSVNNEQKYQPMNWRNCEFNLNAEEFVSPQSRLQSLIEP